jgi:hypothetical protein
MNALDPLPVAANLLTRDMFVADVITLPIITPLLEAATRIGCGTQTPGWESPILVPSVADQPSPIGSVIVPITHLPVL